MDRAVAAAEFLQDETSLIRIPIRLKSYACKPWEKGSSAREVFPTILDPDPQPPFKPAACEGVSVSKTHELVRLHIAMLGIQHDMESKFISADRAHDRYCGDVLIKGKSEETSVPAIAVG